MKTNPKTKSIQTIVLHPLAPVPLSEITINEHCKTSFCFVGETGSQLLESLALVTLNELARIPLTGSLAARPGLHISLKVNPLGQGIGLECNGEYFPYSSEEEARIREEMSTPCLGELVLFNACSHQGKMPAVKMPDFENPEFGNNPDGFDNPDFGKDPEGFDNPDFGKIPPKLKRELAAV